MITRRDFLKLSSAGVATLLVGSRIPGFLVKDAFAATQVLNVSITDALKDMVTHNAINTAQCYFWIYEMSIPGAPGETDTVIPTECPGPTIVALKGDSITINVTNNLDEPHAFYIPGMFDSGPIAPGASYSGTFTATQSGAFLYYDNLNEPVNRVMGLHGALVVRPNVPASPGQKITPYDSPTPHVQSLYNAFGDPGVFPGLAWEEGDTDQLLLRPTPPFRQYCWLTHEASPLLFAEVGSLPAGQIYNAQTFMNKFLKDARSSLRNGNNTPQYFTVNGQSGFFAHFSPAVTPIGRVGEPVVVHILNAGLWTHSMHLHANHFYVTSVNGVVSNNPLWLDVFNVHPMDRIDYTIPFMRPPDIPNARGIGRPDSPLTSQVGTPTWPPFQELDVFIPAAGESTAFRLDGSTVDLKQRMSPLCYPMHDHSEPSQTAQGGNYNMGLISGMYITGDRNTPGARDFPMDEDFEMMYRNIRGCQDHGAYPCAGDPPV